MPKLVYVGDPRAVRCATISLLSKGTISVPSDIAKQFGERGQYFYENVKKDKWYSKYGIMNTLMYVPPLMLEKLLTGNIEYGSRGTIYLNIYNTLLTLLIAFFLFKILSFYTESLFVKVVFILTAFYATFMWNYLRAQSFEIYQTLFFLIFYYYLIKFSREVSKKSSVGTTSPYINLLVSTLFLSFLCLAKLIYICLFPILFIFVLFAAYTRSENLLRFLKYRLCHNFRKYLAYLFGPSIVLLGIILVVNNYKFGSPFDTGYQQWEPEKILFSSNILEGILGYLFGIQRSIFIHYPVLIFSILGIRKFYKKYPFDLILAFFVFIVFLIINSSFANWTGEWCYGPRYLLFILPILSLPFVETLNLLRDNFKKIQAKVAIVIITGVLVWSVLLQINVNSLDFFVFYQVKGTFEQTNYDKKNIELNNIFNRIYRYFDSSHFGKINRDLMAYKLKGETLYPLEQIRPFCSKKSFKVIQTRIMRNIQFNYYWFQNKK